MPVAVVEAKSNVEVNLESEKGVQYNKVKLAKGFSGIGHIPKSHIDSYKQVPRGVSFDDATTKNPPLGRGELVVPIKLIEKDGVVTFTAKVGNRELTLVSFNEKSIPGGIDFYLQYKDAAVPVDLYRASLVPTLKTETEIGRSRALSEWYNLPQEPRRRYFYAGQGYLDERLPDPKS